MFFSRLVSAAILVACCAGPAAAIDIEPITGRFAVGATGIHCVTEPCPWRGIVELDNVQRDPLRPLWSGSTLPTLRASDEDRARIEQAWEAGKCLVVKAAFYTDAADIAGPPLLRVDQILGDC